MNGEWGILCSDTINNTRQLCELKSHLGLTDMWISISLMVTWSKSVSISFPLPVNPRLRCRHAE